MTKYIYLDNTYTYLDDKSWAICENQLTSQLDKIALTALLETSDMDSLREKVEGVRDVLKKRGINKDTTIAKQIGKIEISWEDFARLLNDTQDLVNVFTNLERLIVVINTSTTYDLILPESLDEFKTNLLNSIPPAKKILSLLAKTFQQDKTKYELSIMNYIFFTLANYAQDPTDLVKLMKMQESITMLENIKQTRTIEILSGCLKGIASVSLVIAGITAALTLLIGVNEGKKIATTRIFPIASDLGHRALYDLTADKTGIINNVQKSLRLFTTPNKREPKVEIPLVAKPKINTSKTFFKKRTPTSISPITKSNKAKANLNPIKPKRSLSMKSNKVAPATAPKKKGR